MGSEMCIRDRFIMFRNRQPGKGKSRCGLRNVYLMLWKVSFKASRPSFDESVIPIKPLLHAGQMF